MSMYVCVYMYRYKYKYKYIYILIYLYLYLNLNICIYLYLYMVSCSAFYPSQWYGSPGGTPSFLFASYWQHFWLPSSHLLGTCYLVDDLRSTHTPSKYLCATYSRIYMWHVLCIYFLFTTCVPSQHYVCLTYTVPTIHSNDTIHTIHTIRILTIHTIPIIPIIHTTCTIHMKHNYHTYHTYNTKHTCHTYHTYLT